VFKQLLTITAALESLKTGGVVFARDQLASILAKVELQCGQGKTPTALLGKAGERSVTVTCAEAIRTFAGELEMLAGEVEAGLSLEHPGFGKLCSLLQEAARAPRTGRLFKVHFDRLTITDLVFSLLRYRRSCSLTDVKSSPP
jgi:hypothetical protein